jgi:ribulose-phosphate 3-epimerase
MKIYPSLISADLLNLRSVVTTLDPYCDGYHLDVMDFHFVPNLTWGPAFIEQLGKATPKPFHVHLMVDEVGKWLEILSWRAKDTCIFHYESLQGDGEKIKAVINRARSKHVRIGIAINPATHVERLLPFLSLIDTVLIMSVEPGFSGQPFIPSVIEKIPSFASYRRAYHLTFTIGVDGGINEDILPMLHKMGVDYVGIASALFSAKDSVKELKKMYAVCGIKQA